MAPADTALVRPSLHPRGASAGAHARGLSPLERGLRLFTDVQPGEGLTAVVMFANVFLILCAYYFVKPLRDGWIAISPVGSLSKMEVKAYTSFAQGVILLGAMSAYGGLAARWSRRALITRTTAFCMLNLLGFWLLRPGFLVADVPGAGVAFYVWVGMFGAFVVSQFWAFAADLYAADRGRRLLPLIGVGATAGAAVGALLAETIVRRGLLDPGALLLAANLPLAASIALTVVADARGPAYAAGPRGARRPAAPPPEDAARGTGALALLVRHRYLMAVAGVTLLTNWVGTNGENLLFRVVQDALAGDLAARGITDPGAVRAFVARGTTAFYGGFFFWVNVVALALQALLASRLLAYGGFGLVLLLLPVVSLLTYSTMAFLPVLLVVRVTKTAENAISYSINNTARQVLWLPTTAEMKYKAKPTIETLFVRLGDGLAAATVLVGVQLLALSTRGFFLLNVALVGCWLLAAAVVVREHARLG